jgi:hypothetical protein
MFHQPPSGFHQKLLLRGHVSVPKQMTSSNVRVSRVRPYRLRHSNCKRDGAARLCTIRNCFLHLFLLTVHSHNRRTGLIRQPGEMPVAAASVHYIADPVCQKRLSEARLRVYRSRPRGECSNPITNGGIKHVD